jgi:phosphorylcholine metabolism protein LicD
MLTAVAVDIYVYTYNCIRNKVFKNWWFETCLQKAVFDTQQSDMEFGVNIIISLFYKMILFMQKIGLQALTWQVFIAWSSGLTVLSGGAFCLHLEGKYFMFNLMN